MNGLVMFGLFEGDDEVYSVYMNLSPASKERLVICGALALVVLGILAWALLFRRARRRAARREEHRRRRSIAKRTVKGIAEIKAYVKERQRRYRREHRPRNPTLAETGGLPPIRPETGSDKPLPPH